MKSSPVDVCLELLRAVPTALRSSIGCMYVSHGSRVAGSSAFQSCHQPWICFTWTSSWVITPSVLASVSRTEFWPQCIQRQ